MCYHQEKFISLFMQQLVTYFQVETITHFEAIYFCFVYLIWQVRVQWFPSFTHAATKILKRKLCCFLKNKKGQNVIEIIVDSSWKLMLLQKRALARVLTYLLMIANTKSSFALKNIKLCNRTAVDDGFTLSICLRRYIFLGRYR